MKIGFTQVLGAIMLAMVLILAGALITTVASGHIAWLGGAVLAAPLLFFGFAAVMLIIHDDDDNLSD